MNTRKLSPKSRLGLLTITFVLSVMIFGTIALAAQVTYFQGFETDTNGWSAGATRVASGTNGVISADGSWHGQTSGGTLNASGAFTNWGGYGGNAGCFTSACAANTFPENGYVTSLDIYLDIDDLTVNDTRFDWSSAINEPSGIHRRDFVFNAGFYNDTDATGTGPRFVISASNNATRSAAFPKNPAADPFTITAPGWYTFQHTFTDNGSGVLTVELAIIDADGMTLHTWTLSNPTDIINTTVGSNRYGWFALQEIPNLAMDNAQRFDIQSQPTDKGQCKKGGWELVTNGNGEAFKNQGQCVKYVNTGK